MCFVFKNLINFSIFFSVCFSSLSQPRSNKTVRKWATLDYLVCCEERNNREEWELHCCSLSRCRVSVKNCLHFFSLDGLVHALNCFFLKRSTDVNYYWRKKTLLFCCETKLKGNHYVKCKQNVCRHINWGALFVRLLKWIVVKILNCLVPFFGTGRDCAWQDLANIYGIVYA